MERERYRLTVAEETYAYIGRASSEENANTFKKKVKKTINMLNNIVNTDFKILKDKEYYELLCKIYDISFEEKDLLEVISKKYLKKYNLIFQIPTTMTFNDIASSGHGRSYDWWDQLYQVTFEAAISEDFEIDYNKEYSIQELKDLIKNKNIVLLNEQVNQIESSEFDEEKYVKFETLNIKSQDIKDYIKKNLSLYIDFLKRKFPKKVILKDIKDMVEELQEQIETVTSYNHQGIPDYNEIATICNKWYSSSSEKETYQALQKKLQ